METNWIIIILVIVISIALIIYLAIKNQKDKDEVMKSFADDDKFENAPERKQETEG